MKYKTVILNWIFAFFFAFFLFLGTYALTAQFTLMSKDYIHHNFVKADFFQGMADQLNLYFKQSAGGSGLNPEIYDNFIKADESERVITQVVQDSFAKKVVEIDTTEFQTRLSDYLKENAQVDVDDGQVMNYVEDVATTYRKLLTLPFLSYLVMAIDMMKQVLPFLSIVSFGVVIISGYFLWRLKKSEQIEHHYIENALISAGIMNMLPTLLIVFGEYIKRIDLSPECYHKFMVNYGENYFWIVLSFGLLYIVLGLLLIFIKNIKIAKHYKLRKKQEKVKIDLK